MVDTKDSEALRPPADDFPEGGRGWLVVLGVSRFTYQLSARLRDPPTLLIPSLARSHSNSPS